MDAIAIFYSEGKILDNKKKNNINYSNINNHRKESTK